MKGVKVKKDETVVEAKSKKEVKKAKADSSKVTFMKARNEARKIANLPEAYSKEEIEAHK